MSVTSPNFVEEEMRRAAAFARLVAESLQGDLLPFTRRQRLLRAAERSGMDRFQASLLIAAIQHRQQGAPTPVRVKRSARAVVPTPVRLVSRAEHTPVATTDPAAPRAFIGPRAAVTIAVTIQAAVLAGAWWLLG